MSREVEMEVLEAVNQRMATAKTMDATRKENYHKKRPDLKALTKMQESGAILYQEKRIRHLPGIAVGDQFYSRAEMVVLGIHSRWLNGIDYMGMKYRDNHFHLIKQKGYEDFTFPLATCIVMSGVYEDDFDNANEIIYTGQGLFNWLGNRHQKTEQTLLRGNLALKISSRGSFDLIF
ncbi:histone-lysine N-methyltransferase, H3 lysine-9 specific SUVH4-like [Phragmites australis]|uniref:histone-lysine N-methyltransferase, H3 lysine-9 specific SUVH4-like n=1 Tax=Phragmites australis TaxID=29695 RepID=UPI002D76D381|nr:histone-lysine N-methyltransferase, H3 lysine-9 specific SUVH4-like [Phragmites australis]